MLVHLFGATSSPSCATAAVQRTAEDNKGTFSPEAAKIVKGKFYVDDCLASVKNSEVAISLVKELRDLCHCGGFHLTKWLSNSCEVMESIPVQERAKEARDLDLRKDKLPSERALGVYWAVDSDTLGFNIKLKETKPTRRGILSTVSSTFDPLGLASPYVLNAKIILQHLCKEGGSWDNVVEGSSLQAWNQWRSELPLLAKLRVTRCYKSQDFVPSSCQLHVFSDSSDNGYGVVAYLRFVGESDQIHCTFVHGRSRVAPLKRITTPRMELTAATVAVRTAHMLLKELEYRIKDTVYWTDSTSVLRYIANETTRFHTFVANRVSLIRDASTVDQWRYVDTTNNPADCASRGMSMKKLLLNNSWLRGPDFVWLREEEWPTFPTTFVPVDETDPEVKKPSCTVTLNETPSVWIG